MLRLLILLNLLNLNICLGQQYNSVSAETKEYLDKDFQQILKKTKAESMSIAIIDNGKIVYSKAYGFANKESQVLANDQTVYRIGSCTKTFTALAIMQLMEAGKLNLEEPLATYLPELKMHNPYGPENVLRVKHLLMHTAGIPSDVLCNFTVDDPPSNEWLIAELNKQSLISPVDYHPAYSNPGYSLLGEIISRQSNMPYEKYIQRHILEPLNMNNSSFEAKEGSFMAIGYHDQTPVNEPKLRDVAAGLLHSNVLDMSKFVLALLAQGESPTGQLISKASLQAMERNQIQQLTLTNIEEEGYGYGIASRKILAKMGEKEIEATMLGHDGATFVFGGDYQYIPEMQLGAVIMTNANTGRFYASAKRLLRLYIEQEKGLKVTYVDPADLPKPNNLQTESPYRFADIKGQYAAMGVKINVENEAKIKFKAQGTTIVLKKIAEKNEYSATAKLLNFIPIKMKDVVLKFSKVNDEVFVKMKDPSTGAEGYIGVKIDPQAISAKWKSYYGEYKVVPSAHPCTQCWPGINSSTITLNLSEKNGFVHLLFEGNEMTGDLEFLLDILSEDRAKTHGLGRQSGNTIRLLDNGRLYLSGFEFVKK